MSSFYGGRADSADSFTPPGPNGPSSDDDADPLQRDKTVINEKLQRGSPDTNGATIQDIYWNTRKFVIYEAEDQVRYLLPDDYKTARALRRRLANLGGLRASIEDLRAEPSISATEKKRAAREVAWALADAFED